MCELIKKKNEFLITKNFRLNIIMIQKLKIVLEEENCQQISNKDYMVHCKLTI